MSVEIEEKLLCVECKKQVLNEVFIGDDRLCQDCFNDVGFICNACDETNYTDNLFYCNNCDRNFCDNCDMGINCNDCDTSLCDRCNQEHYHDNDDEGFRVPYRNYTRSARYQSSSYNLTNTIQSFRKYGVEIECNMPTQDAIYDLRDSIDNGLGITEDGSLGNQGVELQTAILSGNKGEKFIKEVCKKLEDLEFSVDNSCGLHIHLSGDDFKDKIEKIRNLWLFYYVFDDVLLSMLPQNRRKNRFCIPLKKSYNITDIVNLENVKDAEKLWYKTEEEEAIEKKKKNHTDSSRYNGINLHSLLAEDNLEIRYHSGTTNVKKILEWVNLHATIMDSAEQFSENNLIKSSELLTLTDKIKSFMSFLPLKEASKDYLLMRIKKFNPDLADENSLCAV